MFHFGPGPKQKDYDAAMALLASEIGIVVDGNKSTLGASSGQYVILRNSTVSGKTDGLYTAAKAIPANTAIDSTYLTAVSGGGINALDAKISTLNGKIARKCELLLSTQSNTFDEKTLSDNLSNYHFAEIQITNANDGAFGFAMMSTLSLAQHNSNTNLINVKGFDGTNWIIGRIKYSADNKVVCDISSTSFKLKIYGVV